jgi:2-(1,2-epoxy-1,2-dihydrophenyl)acetyl-CoA isomerase
MNFTNIRINTEGAVATISLNRPDVYNALNPEILKEITEAFKFTETLKDVKVVVLKGEGKGFCAGQDLKMLDFSKELSAKDFIENFYKPAILSVTSCRLPVICQLHGNAAGAGMALALACDFIIAADTAAISPGFVKIGLAPDSGASYFLLNAVGERKAFEILAMGDKIPADEALRLNLINRVVPEASLDSAVKAIAAGLADGPPVVIRSVKKLLKEQAGKSLAEVISLEAEYQEKAVKTEDFREAVLAFQEKRKPRFKGC